MTDRLGGKLESTDYLPFGHQREHAGTSYSDYKYTDQELDASTGLYNYNARLYDPVIGRFISPDSIVQNFYDPQTLNRYSYARNSPLIYIDPTSHSFWSNVFYGDFDKNETTWAGVGGQTAIGSRAAGEGRDIDTDLPVGKGPGTRTDIDVKFEGQAVIDSGGQLADDLKNIGDDPNLVQVLNKYGESYPPVIMITPRN